MRLQDGDIMDTTLAAADRSTTRRGVLAGAAKLAGAAALALATAGLPTIGGARPAEAGGEFADDLDVLQYLLGLEHLEHALYRHALWRFSPGESGDDRFVATPPSLRRIHDQEQSHVLLLREAIAARGGTPVAALAADDYEFDYWHIVDFLELSAGLENAVVAAYVGAVPAVGDPVLRELVLELLDVETQHAAYLNALIGEPPFLAGTDAPTTRAEVLAFAERFIAR
jgi:hypothetical protein